MVIYDVSGAKGFNPVALILFPFVRKKWFYADNTNRRRLAVSTIVLVISMLALVYLAQSSNILIFGVIQESNVIFIASIIGSIYFLGYFLLFLVFRPTNFSAQERPKLLNAEISWLYLLEWVLMLTFLILYLLLMTMYAPNLLFVIAGQVVAICMFVVMIAPLVDVVRVLCLRRTGG